MQIFLTANVGNFFKMFQHIIVMMRLMFFLLKFSNYLIKSNLNENSTLLSTVGVIFWSIHALCWFVILSYSYSLVPLIWMLISFCLTDVFHYDALYMSCHIIIPSWRLIYIVFLFYHDALSISCSIMTPYLYRVPSWRLIYIVLHHDVLSIPCSIMTPYLYRVPSWRLIYIVFHHDAVSISCSIMTP